MSYTHSHTQVHTFEWNSEPGNELIPTIHFSEGRNELSSVLTGTKGHVCEPAVGSSPGNGLSKLLNLLVGGMLGSEEEECV